MPNAYGRLPKTPDSRDYLPKLPRKYTGQFVDLTDGFPDPPYDQENLGSCVANGTTAAYDYCRRKQGLKPLSNGSRLQLYYSARQLAGYPLNEDTGLQIRDGVNALAKIGAARESLWPYVTSKFADAPPASVLADAEKHEAVRFAAVPAASVDDVIASGYPVIIGFDVFSSFESNAFAGNGIMPIPRRGEQLLGGHCTVLVSTVKDGSEIGGVAGQQYRKARNSWGTSWGLGGWYWHSVSALAGHSDDFWQVTLSESDDAPEPPTPPAPDTDLDAHLWADVKAWANARHTGSNKTAARAVTQWAHAKGL